MSTIRCRAKIRPFVPVNATELQCYANEGHQGPHGEFLRDYAYKGSTTLVSWDEKDRRTFRGDWLDCPNTPCILPAGRRGAHAS